MNTEQNEHTENFGVLRILPVEILGILRNTIIENFGIIKKKTIENFGIFVCFVWIFKKLFLSLRHICDY